MGKPLFCRELHPEYFFINPTYQKRHAYKLNRAEEEYNHR
jgi:hypothetical protein